MIKLKCMHCLENVLSLKHLVAVLALLHTLVIQLLWLWHLTFGAMFLNHLPHSTFAVQM